MLENAQVVPQEWQEPLDSTEDDSLESLFLNSPLLIFTSAALLAALPLAAAIFTPIQFQYEYKKSTSTPSGSISDVRKSRFYPVAPTASKMRNSNDANIAKPRIILQKLCINPIRALCFKLRKFPRRIFAFFVDAFYIPHYRSEWGKYKIWSYRAQNRRPRPALIKAEMKRLKVELKRKSKDFHDRFEGSRRDYFIPRPVAHNHLDCAKVRININGCLFVTQERTLLAFPNSLLGNPSRRLQFYDPTSDAYFFDRNRTSFEAILHFFQSGGQFRRPENVHLDVFLHDAEFYGIPQSVIEEFRKEEGLEKEDSIVERVPADLYMRKLWLLFDVPTSSLPARVLAWISVVVVLTSIVCFLSETHVVFRSTETGQSAVVNGLVEFINTDQYSWKDPFLITETVCVTWFTLELLVRGISCPSKIAFFSSVLNLIDICSVLPYYITLVTVKAFKREMDDSTGGGTATFVIIQTISILRLVRVLRVFKLSRHSEGLKILGRTLRASISELFLLVFFVIIGIILFSSAMYLIEGSSNDDFVSIPAGFWWAMITMTTVGYGDDVPRTWLGKCVGSVCAIAGVFTIALPVPVIVSNFNYFYHQAIDEAQFNLAQINHVDVCPFRPGGGGKKQRVGNSEMNHHCYSEPDSDDTFEHLKFENRNKKRKDNVRRR